MSLAACSRFLLPASIVLLALAPPSSAADGISTPLFGGVSVFEPVFQTAWLAQGSQPQGGQVVITEFLKDPGWVADIKGEWIEVWNSLAWRCNLDGWTLSDDLGNVHTLSSGGTTSLIMRPGERFVLAINGDPTQNGGVMANYVYSGFTLVNGADQILLHKPDGTLVDRVEYDDGVLYPDTPGRSIQLNENFRDVFHNDDPGQWCHSQTHWNAGSPDTGTPGMPNDPCL